MALVTYLIQPCTGGGPAINVDFNTSVSSPVVGGNYFLRFTGATPEGCYEILDTAEIGDGTDLVSYMSSNYGDCIPCLAVVTPTPTVTTTPTKTPTPSVTTTKTSTPTQTPTNTATQTQTPTNTITKTPTNTPTVTTTNTPSVTKTATNTPTPSVTTTQTGTAAITPTPTQTQTGTPAVTPTPSVTTTQTGTAAITPTPTQTQTGTPAVTPTPSHTPNYVISADQQYAYTLEILGSFSGGSADFSGAYAPHPIFTNQLGEAVQQLNAITIGGFNGLNN